MKYSYYIALLFLIWSCAQIKTPTGGEKDVIGPVIVSSFPTHLETNYQAKSVVITFDELVSLTDPKNNIIITPPLANNPEIYLKSGLSLIIEFDGDLQDNTTYTINLGESITDYNESNALLNKLLVFSTGDVIDSLSIKGKVSMSKNDRPCEGCKVMLYPSVEDSVVYKEKPYYFTKTNVQGNFQIDYLRGGGYKIIALLDEDNNFLFDPSSDQIGFRDSIITITPDTNILQVAMKVFKEKPDKQSLLNFKMKNDRELELNMALPLIDPVLLKDSIPISSETYIAVFNEDRDSVSVYLKSSPEKNTEWKLGISDSSAWIDGFSVFFNGEDIALTMAKPIPNSLKKYSINDSLKFRWSLPVAKFDSSKIRIRRDTVFMDYQLTKKDDFTYDISFNKEAGISYYLSVDSAAFMDIYGNTNDSVGHVFIIQEEDKFGQLAIHIGVSELPRVVYLLNDKGNVVRKKLIQTETNIRFIDLDPGDYSLLLLEDVNMNGKWDTGSYLKKCQPENIFRHKETITLRANWELELELE